MVQDIVVADPGFPLRGGVNLIQGFPTPDAASFPKICMSKLKNRDPKWGAGYTPWIRQCIGI